MVKNAHFYVPPGYSTSEGRLVCDEEWDKTAEVQSESEVDDCNLKLMAPHTCVSRRKIGFLDPLICPGNRLQRSCFSRTDKHL